MRKLFTVLFAASLMSLSSVTATASVNYEDDVGVSKIAKQELTQSASASLVPAGDPVLPAFTAPSPLTLKILLPSGATSYRALRLKNKYHSWYLFHPIKEP